jgi:hypothetical protein
MVADRGSAVCELPHGAQAGVRAGLTEEQLLGFN